MTTLKVKLLNEYYKKRSHLSTTLCLLRQDWPMIESGPIVASPFRFQEIRRFALEVVEETKQLEKLAEELINDSSIKSS